MKPLLHMIGKFGLLLMALMLVTNCGGGGGGSKVVVPASPLPVVIATAPAANATGVAVNTIAISATFSKAMNPATITTTSFTLTNTTTGLPVSGTVTVNTDGTVATFLPTPPVSPATPLLPNSTFIATITTAVQDLAGNHLASNFTWSFSTGATADLIAPAVIVPPSPPVGATGVPINELVTVTFSEPLLASSVNTSTFTLTNNTTTLPVTGTVSFNGTTVATFAPTGFLVAGTGYTVNVTGVKDLANNGLLGTFSYTFFTGTTADTTLPAVTASIPVNNSVNVPVNTAIIVTFSKPVNVASVNAATFTLNSVTGPVAGTVSVATSGTSATFTPTSQLRGRTTYTATITTGVTDQAGNHLPTNFTTTFSTNFDTIPPTVLSTIPANGGTNVPLTNPVISVTFDEPMDPRTIGPTTITLTSATLGPIAANVFLSLDGTTAQIVPLPPPLLAGDTITATVTTNVTDLAGNKLATPFSWSFSTAP